MAKKELQWSPFLGQFMTLAGAVFVDRGNNARAVRSLTAAGEIMKERHSSLWLFPEGTRSMRPHHDMLPFKKGAFHTAIQAQVPIVPVICENYWRLYRKGVFESGTLKVKGERMCFLGGVCLGTEFGLQVLPPVPTTGLTTADVSVLAMRVHDMMVESPAKSRRRPRRASSLSPPSPQCPPPLPQWHPCLHPRSRPSPLHQLLPLSRRRPQSPSTPGRRAARPRAHRRTR